VSSINGLAVFSLELSMSEYVALLSMLSNLAIDLCLEVYRHRDCKHHSSGSKKNNELKLVVGLNIEKPITPFTAPRPIPFVLALPSTRSHKRQLTLEYLGTKLLSVGYFLGGRAVLRKGAEITRYVEVSEEKALVPHLDQRHMRFVISVPSDILKSLTPGLWYLPLALVAGVHRWGISLRRVVLSTYAVHAAFTDIGKELRAADLDLLSLGFALASYMSQYYQHHLRELGEFLYAYAEGLDPSLDNWARMTLTKYVEGGGCSVDEFVESFVSKAIEFRNTSIIKAVEGLSTIARDAKSLEHVNERDLPSAARIYVRNARSIKEICDYVAPKGEKAVSSTVIIFFVTETWSLFNILTLANYLKSTIKNLEELKMLLLYTPQALLQTLLSILTVPIKGDSQNRLLTVASKREYLEASKICLDPRDGELPCIEINNVNLGGKELRIVVYLAPVIGKTPNVVYQNLESIVDILLNAKGNNIKEIVIHQDFTGIASVLAAALKSKRIKVIP